MLILPLDRVTDVVPEMWRCDHWYDYVTHPRRCDRSAILRVWYRREDGDIVTNLCDDHRHLCIYWVTAMDMR